jgi:dCMP deaminase
MPRSQYWWDNLFLTLASHIAPASKDPSTKVGALIVRPDRTVAAMGYNGFPRMIEDTAERLNDRELKYALVVHAEMNAILTAREPLHGYTLYTWPFLTCASCAKHVIQAGIKRVVAPYVENERWAASFKASQDLYDEAGVQWALLEHVPVADAA